MLFYFLVELGATSRYPQLITSYIHVSFVGCYKGPMSQALVYWNPCFDVQEHLFCNVRQMPNKYQANLKQPLLSVLLGFLFLRGLKMLEAAFSVEWLARSSRPGEHGRDQGSHSLPGEQAADQADLSTAETPHGRDTANNSEESDRSLTNIDQGFKTQRRPLETHGKCTYKH